MTTAKDFIESRRQGVIEFQISTKTVASLDEEDLIKLLDDFAELKIKEFKHSPPVDSFKIEVKNINCDFETLRDGLDKISPSFTMDKDTFIFHSADMPLYVKLIKFRDLLKEKNMNILVNKDGF